MKNIKVEIEKNSYEVIIGNGLINREYLDILNIKIILKN